MKFRSLGVAMWLLAFSAPCLAEESLVRLVAGDPFPARLAAIDARWNFTFDTGAEERIVGAGDLVCWGGARETDRRQAIALGGGALLAVEQITSIDSQEIVAYSTLFGDLRLPRETVRGVMLRPPSSLWKRDRLLFRLAEGAESNDRILLAGGEELVGEIINAPVSAPEEGAEASPAIGVKLPAGEVTLPLDRIEAIAFKSEPAISKHSIPTAWIGLADGSLFEAAKVTARIESVEIALVGGAKLEATADDLWPAIAFVQPMTNRVIYLDQDSSTEAAPEESPAYRQLPFLDVGQNYVRGGNVLGGRLRCQGAIAPLGIGMPSDARLAYLAPAGARRFQAAAAIDDLAGADDPRGAVEAFPTTPQGSAVFRVLLQDAQGEWRTAFESPVLRAGEEPAVIDVDLAGVLRVALIVDRADRGQVRDYANWLGARWIK